MRTASMVMMMLGLLAIGCGGADEGGAEVMVTEATIAPRQPPPPPTDNSGTGGGVCPACQTQYQKCLDMGISPVSCSMNYSACTRVTTCP